MNIKSIEKNGNQATIVVEIDKDLMETGVNKAYLKARKSILIPGFRKGKAPRKMIEAMYGAHVFFEDGLEEIFPQVYEEAVVKQDVKAVGRPNLTDMQISEDNVVTITLTTDVYPEVTLGQYKGMEVEKAEAEVTDAQVQAELDQWLPPRLWSVLLRWVIPPTSTLRALTTVWLSKAVRVRTLT